MSLVIDTNSKLFRLYASRRTRTVHSLYDVDGVIQADKDTINICSYGRNIVLEILYQLSVAVMMTVAFVLLGMMILTPVLSVGLWVFTDNPFIVFFGHVGESLLAFDGVVVLFAVTTLASTLVKTIGLLWPDSKPSRDTTQYISTLGVVSAWIKSKHGKFCVKLTFKE